MKTEFYPAIDYRGIKRVEVTIRIENQKKSIRKTFYIPKNSTEEPSCQLKNKSGVAYDIPLNIMNKIYNFTLELETKLKNGESIDSILKPNPTLKEFVQKEYESLYMQTKYKDKSLLDNIIKHWSDYKIKDINSINIEQYKFNLKDKNAQSTIRKYCLVLRHILNLAVELGYRDMNPFKNVRLPKNTPENEREPIHSDDLKNLFIQLKQKDESLFLYCKFLYLTGLRSSDAINLTYENIVVIDGVRCFSVQESKNKDKSSRDKTVIPIHPELEAILDKDGTGYILKYEYERSNMLYRMSKLFKDISTKYTPYHLRHTFATELSKAGVTETQINFLIGKLPKGSLKHYLKQDIPTMHKAIKKLTFPDCDKPVEKNQMLLLG
ncbi:tyrosine-type recombinase/integrase [Candidatus Dependentiae bacterium]|nr:tyrosine-type recombinase/integrase [Candidatus Dependentiae bacterium]